MKMTSMKMSESEKGEKECCGIPEMAMKAEYPYGLCIHLDEDCIKKLGIKDLPKVGDEMSMQATVKIKSVSQNESIYGLNRSLELQITEMGLE